jgi:chemotaxis protein methyltransferase CheR
VCPGVTYFFRNPEQYAVLAERAIPTVAARRPAGPLRLLSAGSASGEEAYSIAMTVLQLRKREPIPPERLEVHTGRRQGHVERLG